MRTAEQWLAEYGESHQNPTNKLIHWICVPLIVFSVLGMLWDVPYPAALSTGSPWINWATIVIVGALVFYFSISVTLGLGMVLVSGIMLYIIRAMEVMGWTVWLVCLVIFVLAWIGQFYGHKVEGKKPSFLKDVVFLLIGPIWLLHFVYGKIGLKY
jgi:uncharacterized membrane protein YGL010W